MELKNYQQKVIADLTCYMDLLGQNRTLQRTWKLFWEKRGFLIGENGMPPYQDIIPAVPNLCLKVPTGGGKTFLACNALKPIFDGLPSRKIKAVVWLVPSEAILTQTLNSLRNPMHPYRLRIHTDFGGRVEIYTKQELLNGQNFSLSSVSEQLSIMVLSYDSFRGRKEALKAKQENANLAPMAKALGTPQVPIEGADETALLQVINQLNPVVIVDESHHARSKLSKEMLHNFNPCFILDLTATPTKESNILCYVDSMQLKKENMVKLPVIACNRDSQQEVMFNAIDLRNSLERYAKKEIVEAGRQIRPIVLFQAQPKGKEDSTTFEKLRKQLIESGIPAEQIAIKTASINELHHVDLLAPDCQIRYIITVNALKEGWDCPYAYILASLANKTSRIDVEQIVGRVLRQPYTTRYNIPALNMSYVLSSSNDFQATLASIIRGLNGAGFSDKDCRVCELDNAADIAPEPESADTDTSTAQSSGAGHDKILDSSSRNSVSSFVETAVPSECNEPTEDFLNFDPTELRHRLQKREESSENEKNSDVDILLKNAEWQHKEMETILDTDQDFQLSDVPEPLQDKVKTFYMDPQFRAEAEEIRLPQFFHRVPDSFFTSGDLVLLTKSHLARDFTPKGKSYDIRFEHADSEMVRIDVDEQEGSIPKVFQMTTPEQRYMKEHFSKLSSEKKIDVCKSMIHRLLSRMDMIDDGELKTYIDRIVEDMDTDTLSALEKSPNSFASRIKKHIEALLEIHYEKTFREWVDSGEIVCRPSYSFPGCISPLKATTMYGKSLYAGEEDVNGFEAQLLLALTGMSNVKWWHRNISRSEFYINANINHYPDFIVRTMTGRIVLIETKGDYLNNEENQRKLKVSRIWQSIAGDGYRYFMVFEHHAPNLEGAYSMNRFLEIMQKL